MENVEQEELDTPAEEKAEETIAKKVFDDMQAAFQMKVENLEKEKATLTKQVNDYSAILRNINVQQVNQPKQSSDDIAKKLLGGIA